MEQSMYTAMSCLDTVFNELQIEKITLAEVLDFKSDFTENVVNEFSRLFIDVIYPKRGSKHKASTLIPSYNGPIHPEMKEVWITRGANGYRAAYSDKFDPALIRHRLRSNYNETHERPKSQKKKCYDSLEEYFADWGHDLNLMTIIRNRPNSRGVRFTDKAAAIASRMFAKFLAPHAVERYAGLIMNYTGQINALYNNVYIHKNPNGSYSVRIDENSFKTRQRLIVEALGANADKPMGQVIFKVCACCGRKLPINSFNRDQYQKDLHRTICKDCDGKYRTIGKENEQEQPEQPSVNPSIIKIIVPQPVEPQTPQIESDIISDKEPQVSEQASLSKTLAEASIEDIMTELKSRGYTGEISFRF